MFPLTRLFEAPSPGGREKDSRASRPRVNLCRLGLAAILALPCPALADPPVPRTSATGAIQPRDLPGGGTETVDQALCRVITTAATAHHLPVGFLTRLIWQESSFRSDAISPAGAQGVAQFMPGTAAERGLLDPFDPEQAIPASAGFLADLVSQFGNIGLAAAAYNGGPTRVSNWIAGKGHLPLETEDYVERITGHDTDEWLSVQKGEAKTPDDPAGPSCLELAATLRTTMASASHVVLAPFAPWGVQLAGNFSKSIALRSFRREAQRYASIIGDLRPMIIGTRFRSRGFRAFYRVRVPAESRQAATNLCEKIHAVRGSCIVLKS